MEHAQLVPMSFYSLLVPTITPYVLCIMWVIIRGSIDTINGLGWETLQFSAGAAVLWAGGHIHRHPLMRERVTTHSKVQLQRCWMPRSSEMSGRDSAREILVSVSKMKEFRVRTARTEQALRHS